MTKTLTVDTLESLRLSPNFMLLDFMYDAHSAFSSQAGALAEDLSGIMDPMALPEAEHLAKTLMEPLTELFGPSTIAAGYSVGCTGDSPHNFNHGRGAAVDATFHDWVNPTEDNPEGRAPITMLDQIRRGNLGFDRLIGYAGTEFMCIAAKRSGNSFRVYNNVRSRRPYDVFAGPPQMDKPYFITLSRNPNEWGKFRGYQQPTEGWRRVETEPVFHTRRSLRPQHIRTSRYFTLVDFIKSPVAIAHCIRNIPPVTPGRQIKVARMISEVLDPVVEAVGRLTIIRGLEGKSANAAASAHYGENEGLHELHRWIGKEARVEFVAPLGHDPQAVKRVALAAPHVSLLSTRRNKAGEIIYALRIKEFNPTKHWTSALESSPDGVIS